MTFQLATCSKLTRLAGRMAARFCIVMVVVVGVAGSAELVGFGTSAHAQNAGGPFEGMRKSDEPVHIEADRLEVEDGKGLAQFDGNVSVMQGDMVLKTSHLLVYYQKSGKEKKEKKSDGEKGLPTGNIKRIEASGKVAVNTGDQQATAETMVYDMDSQMITLDGNVTISQGTNILKNCKLIIDMNTNTATFPKCEKGRSTVIFNPNSINTN